MTFFVKHIFVNEAKSEENWRFVHICYRNHQWKTSYFCSEDNDMLKHQLTTACSIKIIFYV